MKYHHLGFWLSKSVPPGVSRFQHPISTITDLRQSSSFWITLEKLIPHRKPWGPSPLWFYYFYCFEYNILSCTSEILQDKYTLQSWPHPILSPQPMLGVGETPTRIVLVSISVALVHHTRFPQGKGNLVSTPSFFPACVEDAWQALDLHTWQEAKVL